MAVQVSRLVVTLQFFAKSLMQMRTSSTGKVTFLPTGLFLATSGVLSFRFLSFAGVSAFGRISSLTIFPENGLTRATGYLERTMRNSCCMTKVSFSLNEQHKLPITSCQSHIHWQKCLGVTGSESCRRRRIFIQRSHCRCETQQIFDVEELPHVVLLYIINDHINDFTLRLPNRNWRNSWYPLHALTHIS